MPKAIPMQEREWRAESDVETLITAAEIEKDSARKKRALVKAKKMAQDADKRAKAARAVAGRKAGKRSKKPHKTYHKSPRAKRGRK